MRAHEIEAIFTALVAEYVSKGYTISLATMRGSQTREIGKVDVRKDGEIIRIVLEEAYDWTIENSKEMLNLTVGRVSENVKANSYDPFSIGCRSIWNDKLEVISRRTFYKLSNSYYTEDESEINAANAKRMERALSRVCDTKNGIHNSLAVMQIILKFIHRQPKCSRKTLDDIEKVRRAHIGACDLHYVVTMKNGKTHYIK